MLLINIFHIRERKRKIKVAKNRERESVSESRSDAGREGGTEGERDNKKDSAQINLKKQARGTLDLPQTSRANPVHCYSTH